MMTNSNGKSVRTALICAPIWYCGFWPVPLSPSTAKRTAPLRTAAGGVWAAANQPLSTTLERRIEKARIADYRRSGGRAMPCAIW